MLLVVKIMDCKKMPKAELGGTRLNGRERCCAKTFMTNWCLIAIIKAKAARALIMYLEGVCCGAFYSTRVRRNERLIEVSPDWPQIFF